MIIENIKRLIIGVYNYRIRLIFNKKIHKIYHLLDYRANINESLIIKHKKLWSKLGSKPNLNWLKVYASVSGKHDHRFIPEYIYFADVEPKLNQKGLSEAYCDKNIYHKIIDNSLLPKIYLRNIDGVFYNERYLQVLDNMVIDSIKPECGQVVVKKALDSGGGRGVVLFKSNNEKWLDIDGNELTYKYLNGTFRKNYLVQEYIEQHPFYKRFNESSVNTVRLLTYRSVSTNKVYPLQAVLRIGKPGAVVDNQASGGIAVGISEEGLLNSFAVNKNGNKIFNYNGISFQDVGLLFKYIEILEIGKELAKQFKYHRLIGFDFCVDKDCEVKLIEINNKNNEINFYQMSNGPLFKEFTDEIISFCKVRERSFSADFEI